jgi:hypothetical protein
MEMGHGCELEFTLDPPDVDGSKSLFPAQDGWESDEGEPEVFDVAQYPSLGSEFLCREREICLRAVTQVIHWRLKERMKTVSVALVACLNIRVDPPDVIKPSPCARLECWMDPYSMTPAKALEQIGKNLEAQYQRWQPRARYKQSLDPTVEDVKKLCDSLRRGAKDERVLFHYNGHGVPRPTSNSEMWVFNKNFTQYIPLSVYDLQVFSPPLGTLEQNGVMSRTASLVLCIRRGRGSHAGGTAAARIACECRCGS